MLKALHCRLDKNWGWSNFMIAQSAMAQLNPSHDKIYLLLGESQNSNNQCLNAQILKFFLSVWHPKNSKNFVTRGLIDCNLCNFPPFFNIYILVLNYIEPCGLNWTKDFLFHGEPSISQLTDKMGKNYIVHVVAVSLNYLCAK